MQEYEKNAAKFYGATPPLTPNLYAKNSIGHEVPSSAAAKFFAVTPPQSKHEMHYSPYISGKNILDNSAAKFYGVTPPDNNRKNLLSKAVAGFYGTTPPGSGSPEVFTKNTANFYGVSPPPSRSPNPLAYNPFNNGNPYIKSPEIPAKDAANFYGVTPTQTKGNFYGGYGGKTVDNSLPDKAIANFYGSTPPPSRSVVSYSKLQNYANGTEKFGNNNVFNRKQGSPFEHDSGLPKNAVAQFYGVTPPTSALSNKDYAAFFGVTPPNGSRANSRFGEVNVYRKSLERPPNSDSFGSNLQKFFGCDTNSNPKTPENNYGKNASKFYGVTPPSSKSPTLYESKAIRLFT